MTINPFIKDDLYEDDKVIIILSKPNYFIKKACRMTGEPLHILVDYGLVDQFVEDMLNGDKFPMPVIDAYGGIDGLHRVIAAKKIGIKKIPVFFERC